ncbi:hypothetical protein Ddye_011704 [Dipteronia dyeriana]|uniref:3-hydroxyisobutyryl-CoA hydrolase n=1 Tax=Dipteronia dyeriana TaxID=168575 RepID=A0AAD9X363_9ROSI|nr:hypothetical protein Ddye_011704 [Dipteronia dyeriana]
MSVCSVSLAFFSGWCFQLCPFVVAFQGNSTVKKVILNRPHMLNALTYEMLSQMIHKLKVYENDSKVRLVILKGTGRAFCTGGDVVALYNFMTAGHWSFGASFFKKFLNLEYLVATYKKPLVALTDGMVMGGGAGVSMLARFKIITENTVLAMPEAAIGSYVGETYLLSRLPGYLGEYLGLTGAQLDGAEIIACGLATHFVRSKDLQQLENALSEMATSETIEISQLISKFVGKPNLKQSSAINRLEIVNKCFSGETVEDILLALEKQIENGREEKWIVDAINSMKSSTPTGLKLFLRSVREGRRYNQEGCMLLEYAVICHVIRRTVSNDFYKGVNAKLLGKGKKPEWQPSKLELVEEEMVERCFGRVDEAEWEPLQLPPRSNLVQDNNMASKL